MALCFLVTWVIAPPSDPDISRIEPALSYWQEHPYLELDQQLQKGLNLSPEMIASWREGLDVETPADSSVVALYQAELDRLSLTALEEVEAASDSLMSQMALVPDRGIFQIGWITSLFVHDGWLHFLGNLLFFYLSALLLEDRWGRTLFLGFYLVGGVVAGASQALVMDDGAVQIVGASGAIAACMGAFAVTMPWVRIRVGYLLFAFIRLYTGSFGMAAWVAGLLWFGRELLSLAADDGSSGVAFMAHVGGFAFGAVVAGGLRGFGFERKLIQKNVEGVEWQASPEVGEAMEQLDAGNPGKALAGLDRALKKNPGDPEVQNARVLVLMRMDRREEAARAAKSLVLRALAADDVEEVRRLIDAFGELLEPSQFLPAQALRLGQRVAAGEERLDFADDLFLSALSGPSPVRSAALLEAARLRFRRGMRPAQVQELLDQLGPVEALEPGVRAEFEKLSVALRETRGSTVRAISIEFEQPFPSGVSAARLKSVDDVGMTLYREGASAEVALPWSGILKVAVAHLVQFEGRANVLVIDLVLDAGAAPAVVRLPSHRLALQVLYPGQPPVDAWNALVREVVERSKAELIQLAAPGQGRLARFEDGASFEAAAYGRPLLRASA